MNILLWTLQALAALLYGASGFMKLFMLEKVSKDVRSFDALPRKAWKALGVLELVGVVGLIIPTALHWHPTLTVAAAAILAIETLVFVWVHVKYREVTPIVFSAALGLMMAFIAYGRWRWGAGSVLISDFAAGPVATMTSQPGARYPEIGNPA